MYVRILLAKCELSVASLPHARAFPFIHIVRQRGIDREVSYML